MANDTAATTRIGIIGFGEVGDLFARGLLARAAVLLIAAYDLKLDYVAQRGAMAERMRRLDARVASMAQEAAADADIVLSAVTACAAVDVAAGCAPALRPGAVFFDVNSAVLHQVARGDLRRGPCGRLCGGPRHCPRRVPAFGSRS